MAPAVAELPFVAVAAGPGLVRMQRDQVAFGDGAQKLDPLVRVVAGHRGEVSDETRLAVGNFRIVLNVLRADVALDRERRFAEIGGAVKLDRVLPVGFEVMLHRHFSG